MEEDFNMSTPGVKVGVSEEEKKLSYYKYFEQDLAPVPAEKIAILQGGPIVPEKCIPFEERNYTFLLFHLLELYFLFLD